MKSLLIITICILAASVARSQATDTFHQEVTWSPNGKQLSFTTYRKLDPSSNQIKSEIFVMDADGKNVKKVADDARWSSWSKDGKRILLSRPSADNKSADLYLVNTDGSKSVQLTKETKRNSTPVLSPDGKKIAFISTRDSDKYQLYVMNSDGTDVKRLTNDSNTAYFNPQWSPDSKRLVYYAEKGDQKDQIWTINADGSDPKLLTGGIGHNTNPAWFPNGERIIFTSNRDGDDKTIYSMKADGTDIKRYFDVKTFSARISPNGKRIAYIVGGFPRTDIYVANADGSRAVKITN